MSVVEKKMTLTNNIICEIKFHSLISVSWFYHLLDEDNGHPHLIGLLDYCENKIIQYELIGKYSIRK